MATVRKVLLIEDSPGDARLLREALREVTPPPLELIHAERFDTGLEYLGRENFAAVLLDLSLPDTRGIDTVVRMQREVGAMPIVVLTGLDDDSMALEAVRAGAQDYLIKGEIDGKLLVRSLSYAIERKRLQGETQRHLERITALKDINAALTSTLELPTVVNILLDKIHSLMPDVATIVRLCNRETGEFEPLAWRNLDGQAWKEAADRWAADSSISNLVLRSRSPLRVVDLQSDPRIQDREFVCQHGLTAYLGIPLLSNDEVLGLIAFYAKGHGAFSDQENEFLGALAGQAAAAIRNSQVHGEIKKLASDLERANHVKDEFLGVMSHELRTPLNVAKGYVEMLQTGFFGNLVAEQQEALDKVAAQHRVQLGMVNNILNAIAMESEVARAHYEDVSLIDLFDELHDAYPQPLDGKLTFHWNYPLDTHAVRTDKTKLQYILHNLINNAVKFTPEGSITVSAKLETASHGLDSDDKKANLVLAVADSGVGIKKEFISVVFEKFSQVDSSTTRVHEGIGLGLYIVKRCTELLHGKVNVESQQDKGTIFTVTLPCELLRDGEREAASKESSPGRI
ncbi:MAG TPA: ATP-binding protein [Candidatus Binatia bacterium]|nr:ATP-binding protein [Candidatus Binatia bacterium]